MSDILSYLMQSGPLSYRQQEPELTYRNMMDYIRRQPELRDRFMSNTNNAIPPQDDNLRRRQIMGESAAVADPFAFSALQRLMGINIPDQILLNEGHGLARKEQYRYR